MKRNKRDVKYETAKGPHGYPLVTIILMDHENRHSRQVTVEMTPERMRKPTETWATMTAMLGPWFYLRCMGIDAKKVLA